MTCYIGTRAFGHRNRRKTQFSSDLLEFQWGPGLSTMETGTNDVYVVVRQGDIIKKLCGRRVEVTLIDKGEQMLRIFCHIQ